MRLKYTGHGFYHQEVADIIAASGNEAMVPNLRKMCSEYCLDILGSDRYTQSLVGYCCMHGGFVEGLIPGNYYGQVVIPRVNGFHGRVANLKSVTKTMLRCGNQLPDLAYFINGKWIVDDSRCVSLDTVIRRLEKHDRIVVKLDHTSKGEGVYSLSPWELQSFVEGTNVGSLAVQRHIAQHPSLAKFGNASTSTLRIYSCSGDSGQILYRAGFTRFGIDRSEHIRSSQQIKIPISRSGEFFGDAFMPNYTRVPACPVTGNRFDGFKYPSFDAAVALVTSLHAGVPYIGIIGWDVVANEAGDIEIMEWNTMHPNATFIEAVMGPCFSGLGWESLWRC